MLAWSPKISRSQVRSTFLTCGNFIDLHLPIGESFGFDNRSPPQCEHSQFAKDFLAWFYAYTSKQFSCSCLLCMLLIAHLAWKKNYMKGEKPHRTFSSQPSTNPRSARTFRRLCDEICARAKQIVFASILPHCYCVSQFSRRNVCCYGSSVAEFQCRFSTPTLLSISWSISFTWCAGPLCWCSCCFKIILDAEILLQWSVWKVWMKLLNALVKCNVLTSVWCHGTFVSCLIWFKVYLCAGWAMLTVNRQSTFTSALILFPLVLTVLPLLSKVSDFS